MKMMQPAGWRLEELPDFLDLLDVGVHVLAVHDVDAITPARRGRLLAAAFRFS